jgi:polysaccharide deacetylase family protein (PEP-CTERM system associated)
MIDTLKNRRHILTVNLEDYFQVEPLSGAIPLRYWPRFDTRVERNVMASLDLLDECGAKATFFTVGWIADKMPDVVREVARRGHEVASKGYYHRSIQQMSRDEFRADVVQSKKALERATGQAVDGYRIARGWFSQRDLWALDILADEGFAYDSSLRQLGFTGVSGGRRDIPFVHNYEGKTIRELPLATWQFAGFSLPVSGGNYVRQLPDSFVRRRVANWIEQSDAPLVFYFHVWELDAEQPRITAVSMRNRVRQYRNLEQMPGRIRRYLKEYAFTTAGNHLGLAPRTVDVAPQVTSQVVAQTGAARVRRPVTIVVPCYNEENSLGYLKRTLDKFSADNAEMLDVQFVLVDDGSRDKTWEGMQAQFGESADCQLVRHPKNRGIAAACLTGIEAAKTETVCVIDADCSFDPARLADMIPMLEDGVDMVTASPYHRDGGVLNVPAWRLVLSKGASQIYAHIMTNKLASYTACFRVYRRSTVVGMKLDNYGFTGIAEILARLDQSGARILECPAVLETRLLGVSKMKVARTIMEHAKLMTQLARGRMAPTERGGPLPPDSTKLAGGSANSHGG